MDYNMESWVITNIMSLENTYGMENIVCRLLKLHVRYFKYTIFHLRYYYLEEASFSLALRKKTIKITPKI